MRAYINEINNPFTPHLASQKHLVTKPISIRDWLEERYNGFIEFSRPTICLVNGDALLREQWDYQIKDNDVVNFVEAAPGEPLTIFMVAFTVVATAAALYYAKQVPKPNMGQMPDQDPVYTLSGQSNRIKLMNPIEVPYGRNKIWPSYAARSYNKFDNDDQYLYSLMVIGQGSYHIEAIQVEDTNVSSFQDIQYEVIQPGGKVTLFRDLVITSVEVSNVLLQGPQRVEDGSYQYKEQEWYGGFVVNPPTTKVTHIEIDYAFPFGLYNSNKKGGLDSASVDVEFEYREVDDAGNALGDWQLLLRKTISAATVNAKRYTESFEVFPARYEVRAKRYTKDEDDSKRSDKIHWVALRGLLPDLSEYGDLTLLAIKAKASNNINDSAANRFNVIATRKLPVWSPSEGWSQPRATRSIVWAFCDVFMSTYGAKMGAEFLDLPYLYQLDNYYDSKGYYFDWVFDQKTTVWDAAKAIARAGRAVPMLNGSVVSLVLDEPKNFPVTMFNKDNIVFGSFRWDIKLFEVGAYDSVEIEYTDPVTWNPETILCKLPESDGAEPEKIKLAGCTNRDQAYREGMYIASTNFYVRENITFTTGMEGHIPTYGDLISVSHDLPRWGQAGVILDIRDNLVEVSEPLEFSDEATNYIVFRNRDGSAVGPFVATKTNDPYVILIDITVAKDMYVSDLEEYPLFQFGVADKWAKLCKVVNLTPSDGETVEIACTAYDARVFAYDNQTAPPKEQNTTPVIPSLPVIDYLEISQIPNNIHLISVNWSPALGAIAYILQQSWDGTNWDNVVRTSNTGHILQVLTGHLYLRVAAINAGAGPWVTWDGEVGIATSTPIPVQNLMLQHPFTGTYIKAQWDSVSNASEYEVRVKTKDGRPMRTVTVTSTTFTYSAENALEDGANTREFTLEVFASNLLGLSTQPAVLEVANPRPPKLDPIQTSIKSQTATTVTFTINWPSVPDVDLLFYRVWGSEQQGFIPSASSLKYEGLGVSAEITFNKEATAKSIYLRVAAVDIWDDRVNLSDQVTLTIPAKT